MCTFTMQRAIDSDVRAVVIFWCCFQQCVVEEVPECAVGDVSCVFYSDLRAQTLLDQELAGGDLKVGIPHLRETGA